MNAAAAAQMNAGKSGKKKKFRESGEEHSSIARGDEGSGGVPRR